jgi:hypothetical protein
VRLEYIGYAVVLLPLLIGLWAHATGRKGVLRVLGAALLFVVATVASAAAAGLAFVALHAGSLGVLIGITVLPLSGVLAAVLWMRFVAAVWAKPEP